MSTEAHDLEQTPSWQSGTTAALAADRLEPGRLVGHYRLEGVLGEGTYGRVYLARHEVLGRRVAVKVLHRRHDSRRQEIRAFLNEALILADLDHPGIVPVFDAGWEEDGLYYIVSKYIEGSDLGQALGRGRLGSRESAAVVESIAGALDHAHSRGLVHRDIKPANILIDASGRAYVTDFGVALRDRDFGLGARLTGTPAYMSPEQARGEAHRVDGRSDVFCLGVVLYELLTGKRPFHGRSIETLSDQILRADALLPREIDPGIPQELERICLKAMAKRAGARYTSAEEMAVDIRKYLNQTPGPVESAAVMVPVPIVARDGSRRPPPTPPDSQGCMTTTHAGPEPWTVKIRPRGLRPFEAEDADFFLDLLPGPRGLFGLPESVAFWRSRIEGVSEKTLRIGLIFGPSGSGKTSMIRAGLLPRLSRRIVSVPMASMGDDNEALLLREIRHRCPGLPQAASLAETLVAVRKGEGLPRGGKLLLVLDQFERWLEPDQERARKALGIALRQCDGEHLQVLAVARDDCWVAASRFMRGLDERIAEGVNTTAIEAFDARHAERVLEAFGRGYGALPEESTGPTDEVITFLKSAVRRLAEGESILPIRLALFAQMIREKPWNAATLGSIGAGDLGVRFLEQSFGGEFATAHPEAVRPVLAALLPDSRSPRTLRSRSHQELMAASGLGSRPREFEALMQALVGKLGLVALNGEEGSPFQLVHDFILDPLREWMNSSRVLANEAPARPINLNSATEEELMTLRGIGPTMARRIFEGRPFGTVEDLIKVRGITRSRLSKIRTLVTAH